MADTQNANGVSSARARAGRALRVLGILAIVLFDLWLIADQEIAAGESPADDAWFLQKGKCGYWFDDGYSQMSFIKEPVYPLFVWACYNLGLPLRLMAEAAYLAAAGFLAWCLVYRQTRAGIGLLVFAVIALHPLHLHPFQRTIYSTLYPSLLMVTMGALFLQVKLRDEPGRWRRWLLSGLALGLLWNLRPERPLVLLLVVFFLVASVFGEWRRRPTLAGRLRGWVGEWVVPLAILTAITLGIMSANYARWGVFGINDLQSPGFSAAYRALASIKPEKPLRHVVVTREARERAYAVSPSFRELRPFLEGDLGAGWAANGNGVYNLPPGEIASGWFIYALRDAAALAGHYTSAQDSESFYRRIAQEIDAAAAEGRLETRWVPPFAVDPSWATYQDQLIPSWRALWWWCFSGTDVGQIPDVAEGETLQDFNLIGHRRWIAHDLPMQSHVRGWIWTGYGQAMQVALVAAWLVAATVLLLPRAPASWALYALAGGTFAIAGLSRLALFTLIDASSFPSRDPTYYFPASLAMTIMATWLLAEGLHLLYGAIRRPSPVPAEQPAAPELPAAPPSYPAGPPRDGAPAAVLGTAP
jgi:hypothetical protein